MLRIWGRSNSVNVQKVLWCCDELGLPFERIDAGLKFGLNDQPSYLALNPNGRVPMIEDGDFYLWESNSIMRYLAMQYGANRATLYPPPPQLRSSVDRWLDWTISTLAPAEYPVFIGYVRTPPEKRDEAALKAAVAKNAEVWQVVEDDLQGRAPDDQRFTLADIALGCFAKRWFNIREVAAPPMPNLERWYKMLANRPAFQRHMTAPLT